MTKDLPASPDWRGLCEELADSIEVLLEMRPADAKPLSITEERYARARALLAQPEPEVGPTDEELLELYRGAGTFSPVEFAREAIAADRARRPAPAPAGEVGELVQPPGRAGLTWQGVIEGLRDVLNDESEDAIQRVWQRSRILDAISVMEANPCPAPAPAEGEVAELVASLRDAAASNERIGATQAAVQLTRAADLLEQRQAAPVPVEMIPVEYYDLDSGARIVSEPSEEGPGGCWVVLNSRHVSPLTEFPTAEAAWIALQAAHALPLPSGEVG